MSNENEQTPVETEADVDTKTEAEHQSEAEAQDVAQEVAPERDSSTAMTAGLADPPSPLLDSEDGGSEWDPENFATPTLEEMPTEGPGSPGYDVYAPENAKWEHPELFEADAEDAEVPENHDDEDVKAALEAETSDGVGETDPSQLPDSDVDPQSEVAEPPKENA